MKIMMAQNSKLPEDERRRILKHYERQLDIINGELHSLNQQAAELIVNIEILKNKIQEAKQNGTSNV